MMVIDQLVLHVYFKKDFYKKMSFKNPQNYKKMFRKSPASNVSTAIFQNAD